MKMIFAGKAPKNTRKRKISFHLVYGSSAKNRQMHSRTGNFFYLLLLIALGLFSMLPFFYSVLSSFKPLNELLVFRRNSGCITQPYQIILTFRFYFRR